MEKLQKLAALRESISESTELPEPEKLLLEAQIDTLMKNEAANLIMPEIERQIIKPFEKLFKGI